MQSESLTTSEKNLTSAEQEELYRATNEDSVKTAPRYVLPILRLNGKDGKFYRLDFTADGKAEKTEMPFKEIKGIILTLRRSYAAYSKKVRLYTNEHSSLADKIVLFETRETQDGWTTNQLDEDYGIPLRKKYQNLKMNQIIYFLLLPEKEIVKQIVRGKGLSYLFDYFRAYKPEEHLCDYETVISVKEDESDLGQFYSPTFAIGAKFEEVRVVLSAVREISQNLEKIAKYYRERKTEEELKQEELVNVPPDEETPPPDDNEEITLMDFGESTDNESLPPSYEKTPLQTRIDYAKSKGK